MDACSLRWRPSSLSVSRSDGTSGTSGDRAFSGTHGSCKGGPVDVVAVAGVRARAPAFGTPRPVSQQEGLGKAARVGRGCPVRSAAGPGRSQRVHPARRGGEDVVADVGRVVGEG